MKMPMSTMVRVLSDRNASTTSKMIATGVAMVTVIALVFAAWRLQIASREMKQMSNFIYDRDKALMPIVDEIRGNVQRHREFMDKVEEYIEKREKVKR
jgi:hypothetical protein